MEFIGPKSLKQLCSRVIVNNLIQRHVKELGLSSFEPLESIRICNKFQSRIIPHVESWWRTLPCNLSIRKNIREALDELSEVNHGLEVIENPVRLLYLLLKLLILDEVLLYEEKDYFPSSGDSTEVDSEIAYIVDYRDFYVTKLTLNCHMSADIIAALLSRCPHLESLSVSKTKLKDQVIGCMGNNCPKLKYINLAGSIASKTAIIRGFFKDATIAFVEEAFLKGEPVPLSFPNLKALELGMSTERNTWVPRNLDVDKYILFYYKSLNFYNFYLHFLCLHYYICSSDQMTETNMDKLKKFSIKYELLYSYQCDVVFKSAPSLRHIELKFNCDQNFTKRDHLNATKSLEYITSNYKHISYSVKYQINLNVNLRDVNPTLKLIGAKVIAITIEILDYATIKASLLDMFKTFIANCPAMEQLKLFFISTDNISVESMENEKFEFQHNKLKEIWLHQFGTRCLRHGHIHYHSLNLSQDLVPMKWLRLLNFFPRSSFPELEILSLRALNFDDLSGTSDSLPLDVTTLHLENTNFNKAFTAEQITNIVKRFRYLKNLHLEGIDKEIIWKIKNYFANTNLKICLGSVELERRSKYNWLCGNVDSI